jgi:hypothetical protein
MSETPPSRVLGSLPSSRPERRSAKRKARTDTLTVPEAAAAGEPNEPAKANAPLTPKSSARPRAAKKTVTEAGAADEPKAAPVQGTRPASAPKPRPVSRPAPKSRPEPLPRPGAARPVQPTPSIDLTQVAGLVIKATAELAEIGLSASARALKLAVSRLPRP